MTYKYFIKEINSIDEIDFSENYLKKDDLILFDIDHTIIRDKIKKSLYLQYILSNDPYCYNKIYEIINQYGDLIDMDAFLGFAMKNIQFELIEKQIIERINSIKNLGINVIGITGMLTGFNIGLGKVWQEWRCEMLKKEFDLEFSFDQFSLILNIYNDKRPIFHKGIIFTDYEEKGKALNLFLKEIDKKMNKNHQFKRIIMIDDSDKYLQSVMDQSIIDGYEFHGYQYKAHKICEWTNLDEEILIEMINEFKKFSLKK